MSTKAKLVVPTWLLSSRKFIPLRTRKPTRVMVRGKPYANTAAAAQELGVHLSTIHAMIRRGQGEYLK